MFDRLAGLSPLARSGLALRIVAVALVLRIVFGHSCLRASLAYWHSPPLVGRPLAADGGKGPERDPNAALR